MLVDPIYLIAAAIGIAGLMFFLGWLINSKIGKNNIASAEEKAKKLIEDADKEAKHLKKEKLLEVKDEWLRKKQEFDTEVNQRRQKIQSLENQSVELGVFFIELFF